ncbi:amidohydrolase [Leifsonia sp. Root112D2]|jgi:amidohydrolase|uniref:amidohydrolase n=1 Tax=Leifsonia sp. Root112D2 TaxID=1736426 RepID=UPI0006F576C6|nr:amidohydrolase [Leifsonia sp. Root112D2]KQV07809.1 amidohydrolase [Leifsonia sp. Root112D2]
MNAVLHDAETIADRLVETYKDLHSHPELSFAEHRTAGIVEARLGELGFEVTAGIGQTGVVGVARNGEGPTVLVRADMDALPVHEETGLDYASTARTTDPDGHDVAVMHACGHDVHVTCLLGAAELLLDHKAEWSGTLVVLFQPAEEYGGGALEMINDRLYERVPTPDIVLGQHVGPAPAGLVGAHPGSAFAGADSLRIRMFGRGGHGSRPETTIDPIVMAAATVMRLQTVVSRDIAGSDMAVVTVGQLHAGTKNNIIPEEATLGVTIRTATVPVRERVLGAMRRIVYAEAAASGAEREPEIVTEETFPVLVNDPDATERTVGAFRTAFGEQRVLDPGAVTGSEDVGELSTAAGAPLVYWILGGVDAQQYAAAVAADRVDSDIPSNHSPHFAPVIRPTLDTGIAALSVAALEWFSN